MCRVATSKCGLRKSYGLNGFLHKDIRGVQCRSHEVNAAMRKFDLSRRPTPRLGKQLVSQTPRKRVPFSLKGCGGFKTGQPAAASPYNEDELMTGWRLAPEGCPDGELRIETTCCVSPRKFDKALIEARYNGTRGVNGTSTFQNEEATALDAARRGDLDTLSKSKLQDYVRADEHRSG